MMVFGGYMSNGHRGWEIRGQREYLIIFNNAFEIVSNDYMELALVTS